MIHLSWKSQVPPTMKFGKLILKNNGLNRLAGAFIVGLLYVSDFGLNYMKYVLSFLSIHMSSS
jgi:hypothetical protein